MPRKLKTYMTSMGFFDLAVAAPSMKAALEAWGSGSNLFHQGFAKQVDDPDTVAATMAKPGVVLQRPIGTKGNFREHAHLPSSLELGGAPEQNRNGRKRANPSTNKLNEKEIQKAALEYERERQKQELERRNQEVAEVKRRKRREDAIGKLRSAFEEAEQEHQSKASAIEQERSALERRARREEQRWGKEKERLEDRLRKAGG